MWKLILLISVLIGDTPNHIRYFPAQADVQLEFESERLCEIAGYRLTRRAPASPVQRFRCEFEAKV